LNCSRKKFGPNFKELWNFLPKKLSLSSQKYEFGIPDPGVKKAPIPDPGSGSATLGVVVNGGASCIENTFTNIRRKKIDITLFAFSGAERKMIH
jgi:hypothetical protein